MRRWLSAPKLFAHFLQFRAQFFDVSRAAILVANGIDVEHRALELQPLEKPHQHLDHFRVDPRRVRRPQHFRANLIKLAIAPLLRPLAAEHRPHVVQLHVAGQRLHPVLDVRAHNGGCRLRPQAKCEESSRSGERIHLLGNDVRFLTDGSRKQFRLLKNRQANFGEAKCAEHIARGLLDASSTARTPAAECRAHL